MLLEADLLVRRKGADAGLLALDGAEAGFLDRFGSGPARCLPGRIRACSFLDGCGSGPAHPSFRIWTRACSLPDSDAGLLLPRWVWRRACSFLFGLGCRGGPSCPSTGVVAGLLLLRRVRRRAYMFIDGCGGGLACLSMDVKAGLLVSRRPAMPGAEAMPYCGNSDLDLESNCSS